MSDGVGDNKWIPKAEGDATMTDRIVWSTRQIDDIANMRYCQYEMCGCRYEYLGIQCEDRQQNI